MSFFYVLQTRLGGTCIVNRLANVAVSNHFVYMLITRFGVCVFKKCLFNWDLYYLRVGLQGLGVTGVVKG